MKSSMSGCNSSVSRNVRSEDEHFKIIFLGIVLVYPCVFPEPGYTYVKQNDDLPLLIVCPPKHNYLIFLFCFGRLFRNSCFK